MRSNKFSISIIIGFICLCSLVSVGIWYYLSHRTINTKHVFRTVYEPPIHLGEIHLEKGAKPAWVYCNNDRLYLTSYDNETVEVLSLQGKKISSFTPKLPGYGCSPQGLAKIDDKMLIADYASGSLALVDSVGKVLDGFFETPNKLKFRPVGIWSRNKVFYVTNVLSNGWMAIGNDGYLINVVQGAGESNLGFPYGIVVTDDGRVIVTDPKAGKIKAFTCAGRYIYDFETSPIGLKNPQGLTIDGYARIHVVDNGTGKVFVYDNTGKFLFTYGEGLKNPSTISIDIKNRVAYITNTENETISAWGL